MVIKTRLKIYGQENNFCRRQKSNTGVFGGMLRNCQEQRFFIQQIWWQLLHLRFDLSSSFQKGWE